MGNVEITVDSEILTELLFGDRQTATEKLIKSVFNEVMEAEMTEYLQAEPGEETDKRQGYRNGHYERTLTMSVGTVKLTVPRDRAGEFDTAIFERYKRNAKALVLAMMEMVINGFSTRKVSPMTEKLCGKDFSQTTVSRLTEKLNELNEWLDEVLKADTPDKAKTASRRLADDFEDDAASKAVDSLEAGLEDAIQVLHLPDKYRRRLRTTNSCKRLIQEVRRRQRVIRIFPYEESYWRLIGAYLAEQHEEWMTGRKYFDMTEYNEWKQSNTEQKEYSAAAE